jgi:hypothetical protein
MVSRSFNIVLDPAALALTSRLYILSFYQLKKRGGGNMKLITFERDGDIAAGYIDGEDAVVCTSGPGAKWALLGLIAGSETALRNGKRRAPSACHSKT